MTITCNDSSQILLLTFESNRVSSGLVSDTHGGHVALPDTKFCDVVSWLVWTAEGAQRRKFCVCSVSAVTISTSLMEQTALQELMEWAGME
jgi:hypothetical protein